MLVHELMQRAALEAPQRPALIADDGAMSYADLRSRTHAVASVLDAAGLGKGDRIIVLLRKSADAVAAILGAMAAGGTYVPVDPALPHERAQAIVEDAGAAAIIAAPEDQERATALASAAGSAVILLMAGQLPMIERSAEALLGRAAPDRQAPATILFTSGSTSRPKGVCIGHAQIVRFAAWAVECFGLRPEDRLMSHAPLAFDLSFLDLFAAFCARASVALVSGHAAGNGAHLWRICRETGVSVWQSVPSALALLADAADAAGDLPEMRRVLFAGERMPVPLLERLRVVFPHARLFNIYGCTETNDTFLYEVPASGPVPDPLPIGRPLPDVSYRIVDKGRA